MSNLRSRALIAGRRLVDVAPPRLALAAVDVVESRFGETELRLLPALVRAGAPAADIGANRGLYARRLARLCPLVLAFEPQPWLARRLAHATPANVLVFPVALSNTPGEATLRIPRVASVTAHTRGTLGNANGDVTEQTVVRLRLDDLGLGSLGFAKVDVEGHEMALLDGAAQTIERCRPRLVIECDARTGAHPAQVLERLAPLGYEGWFHRNGEIVPVADFDTVSDQGRPKEVGHLQPRDLAMNFVFVPGPEAGEVVAGLRALLSER